MLYRLFICFAALILVFGCGPAGNKSSNGKLKVVSTVGMIRDAVAEVGGEHVESIGLMGPGVDPHLYRATAGDVQKLESADIVFYGGLELEGRMTDIFVKMAGRGVPTYSVSEGIPVSKLREPPEFHGKFDPHVWFDVTLWKHAVETMRDGLIKARPELRAEFEKNSKVYLEKLDELHQYVQAESEKVPEDQRVLVTAHDAFGYFGRQYGFEVIGIQGTSTATEAAAGSLRSIAETIARRKVKAIFVESSVPPATIEALQQAIKSRGWQVKIGGQLFSDAMGKDGTPEGTYIGMVRHNIDTIVGALK
ncbi:MAG: zinc ABC transporter substrate-binding protein [Fimbriimonadaceae bacterium]|nr:zinc ABC transporter substrate-binding protein [Fimbriimonadaceae bacterium]